MLFKNVDIDGQYDEVRYNFYTAMEKVTEFYEGWLQALKPTMLDLEDFDVEMYEEADKLGIKIKNFFDKPIVSLEDLINKGLDLMELFDQVTNFEYWYA